MTLILRRAHIEHALAGDLQVSNASAALDARLDAKQADLDDVKARIAQLDQTRRVATKGHTKDHHSRRPGAGARMARAAARGRGDRAG